MEIFLICFVISDERNSESESVTNEDSSDNQIGPIHSNHNTTTAHDTNTTSKPAGKNSTGSNVSDSYISQNGSKSNNLKSINGPRPSMDKSGSLLETTPAKELIPKETLTPSSLKHKTSSINSAKKSNSNKKARHR